VATALDALAAIQRHPPGSDERGAMRGLAAYAMDAPRQALPEWLQTTLRELSLGSRVTLLNDITDLGAVIVGLDGGHALAEVARAVRDAYRWWPSDPDNSQPMSWRPAGTGPGPMGSGWRRALQRRADVPKESHSGRAGRP
jgi:hypothetical protein